MTILDLGRIRAEFKGDWVTGTTYEFLDVVSYGGNTYTYIDKTAATAGAVPSTATTKWKLMSPGMKSVGAWATGTAYKIGELISYGGKSYLCKIDHTGHEPPNTVYWQLVASGIQYEGTYNNSTVYQPADIVKYGGNLYNCIASSTGNLPTDTDFWFRFVPGLSYRGTYASATDYFPGEYAVYNNCLYVTKLVKFTSSGTPITDTTNWDLLLTSSGFGGASSTSLTITNSVDKAFTMGLGYGYNAGSRIRAVSNANNANFMEGQVASYSGGVLTIHVDRIGGSGTFADWIISLVGTYGATGPSVTGPTGAASTVTGPTGPALARPTGTAVLVGGTVTVANVNALTGSVILLTSQVDGGTPGFLRVSARVNATSFTITSSSGSDTSTVGYEII